MTKKNSDIIAGIVFFAFAGLLYIAAGFMPTRTGGIAALNTGFYPRILAFLLAVLSVLMVIEAIRTQNTTNVQSWCTTKSAFLMFFVTLVMLVVYVFIMKIFGFATASFLFITSLMWMLTDKQERKPVLILGVSVGITAIIYSFSDVLSIPFHQGL
jgi:hypothetical protein